MKREQQKNIKTNNDQHVQNNVTTENLTKKESEAMKLKINADMTKFKKYKKVVKNF